MFINLLPSVTYIDIFFSWHIVQAIVTDEGYRWIGFTAYCVLQRLPIDTSQDVVAGNGHRWDSAQSNVANKVYLLTVSPIYRHTYIVSYYYKYIREVIKSPLCDSIFIYPYVIMYQRRVRAIS